MAIVRSSRPSFVEALAAWAPVIGWAAFIFSMSTETFARPRTRPWVAALVGALWPGASAQTVEWLNSLVRTSAHAAEYFVFAWLMARALGATGTATARTVALAGFLLAAAYSFTDEAHQALVASRSAALSDCGVDALGAAAASLMWWSRSRG